MPEPRVFRATVETTVEVTVTNPDVLERVTGPNGDDWRAHVYPLRSEDEVIAHLAYNAVANGVESAAQLDGWADLDRERSAVMLVNDFELLNVEETNRG